MLLVTSAAMSPPQPTLHRAPVWSCPGGTQPFTVGYAVHRQVMRLAAYRRNLRVDAISRLYCTISDGSRTVAFWEHNPDTTSRVARCISNSKPTSKVVLARAGLQVPTGRSFSRTELDSGWEYALQLGLPVVVKPSHGSGGQGVTADIKDADHFRLAWKVCVAAFAGQQVVVEKHIAGQDYRLLVVGNHLVAAIQRIPAYVEGDGQRTIMGLIEAKAEARRANPFIGSKSLKLTQMMERNLATMNLTRDSILPVGQRVTLHPVANVGTGGETVDVTDRVHPDFEERAVRALRALPGAEHVGVDLLAEDISSPASAQEWSICEVNTCPDIALHHFPMSGTPRDAAGVLLEHLFPGVSQHVPPRVVRAHLTGKITTLSFYQWCSRLARLRGLTGRVRTIGTDQAELFLSGAPNAVEAMIEQCRRGSPSVRPKRIVTNDWQGELPSVFEIDRPAS